MRILYASERPPYPFFLGGAARCAHRILHALARELGAECLAVGSSDYDVTPWSYPVVEEYAPLAIRSATRSGSRGSIDCGYECRVFPDFTAELARLIDSYKPDVVWAQLEGAKFVLELARRRNIQGLFFVHDAEGDPTELRQIAELDCHLVCSSGFLAKKVARATGRRTHVVYPCPETSWGVEGDSRGFVTMINPHRVKGVETFLEIAQRLPSEKFLLVESWKLSDEALTELGTALDRVPNVRFEHRVSDMRQIYARTRLLLVPSVWEEGFGMVAVEAQSCRIPVIASHRGGLPESVGDGGILISDYLDVESWVAATRGLLNDPGKFAALAGRAARYAARDAFTVSCSARRFHSVCSGRPRARGALSRGIRALVEGLDAVPGVRRVLRQIGR